MSIEPIILTVSQVRAAIDAAEPPPLPAPVNALTGGIFHAVAASLSASHPGSWQRLGPHSLDSPEAIQRHLYQALLGPRLVRSRAALQGRSDEVQYLWEAVRSFSYWLSEVLSAARDRKQIWYEEEQKRWHVSEDFAKSECQLAWEIKEKRWRSPLRIEGRLDALVGHPAGGFGASSSTS